MNWILSGIYVAVAIAMFLPALWRKEYRLQFPCLAALAVFYQVALPMLSLNLRPEVISQASLARFSIMAILCLGAAWAGYEIWKKPSGLPVVQFDFVRLTISAIILFAIGGFFAFRLSQTTPDISETNGNWTGIATVYVTLAQVARYGAILAAILYMRTKNARLLVLILPQLWNYYSQFIAGRRAPTGELVVIFCMLLWFYRKWAIPRWALLLGVFGMALFCFNIKTIRTTVDMPLGERIGAVLATDLLHTITPTGMSEDNNYVEVYNAAQFMEAKVIGGNYTYGCHFWNQIVFGFVPAQFVGRDFKDSLMIPLADDTKLTGFEKSVGTCETGIGEAFMAFGYFGCVLFFILGAFMRWLWDGASRNSILHQFLLMFSTVAAVTSFTLQLWGFLNMLVNLGIFAAPLLWWSREGNSHWAPVRNRLQASRRARRREKSVPRWAAIKSLTTGDSGPTGVSKNS